jgi:murein DD-endopeptidase MepM/ murein hydrolase activator NlpD
MRAHKGIDFAAAMGSPIRATANGTIIRRNYSSDFGNIIEIRHTNGLTTRYGHMSRFASGFSVGSRVSQGDVIGYVGMTGLATGPHVHYEVIRNGIQINPESVNTAGSGEPIPKDALERWTQERTTRMALLDVVPALGTNRYAATVPPPPSASVAPSAVPHPGGGE